MDIQAYLDRIGYRGPLNLDFETLRGLHRQHLLTIPYENLDIHLGNPIVLDQEAFFNKLVGRKRGGWCYEMNGLFAAVLQELGFKVTLLAGSVRDAVKDATDGNHLVLLVGLDQPYLVDVGFGDGLLEPVPLVEGGYTQGHLNYRLAREGDHWVFHNHPDGGATRFDFTLEPYELPRFAAMCHYLQTSPASGFTQKTVCQRLTGRDILVLRGAVFKVYSPDGMTERFIEDQADYRQVLQEQFGLDLGDVSALWAKVWAAHQAWQNQLAATNSVT